MIERTALVTGASSGIGAAIAARLLESGWSVVGLSRSAPVAHPRLRHVAVDIADAKTFGEVIAGLEDLQAVVHAAGVLRVGNVGNLDLENGRQMWRLHVEAATQLIDRFGPTLPEGGRIVLIGSRTAQGSAGRAQYAASKAALRGLARSAAIELAPRRVAVNLVSPGATDTPMLRDTDRASVAPKMPPMGRLLTPGEVAGTVAFLLGPDAASITGQEIVLCGGGSL